MISVQDRLIGEMALAEKVLYLLKSGHSIIDLQAELEETVADIRWVINDLKYCEKE